MLFSSTDFGENFVKSLGKPLENDDDLRGIYRDIYFDDIKYRSKLRKIRDKISSLNEKYQLTLLLLQSQIFYNKRNSEPSQPLS